MRLQRDRLIYTRRNWGKGEIHNVAYRARRRDGIDRRQGHRGAVPGSDMTAPVNMMEEAKNTALV